MEVDTINKYAVAMQGENIIVMNPPRRPISREDALNLAAYLVSMVGDDDLWEKTLQAIQNA